MAKATAEVVPGEVSQEQWDAKYGTTTKALKDMGGTDSKNTDVLPEGTANKYDTGVPPATQDDLPDGTTAKQFSTTEQAKLTGIEAGADVNPADLAALDPPASSKLGGIEEGAAADQTGTEIQTAIKGLPWAEREVVVTEPLSSEHKVRGIHRNAAGNLEYDYEDVPEA